MARGSFITLEGGEGAGKSTQAKRLVAWLLDCGITVVATREPGGTPTGEQIRDLVIRRGIDSWNAFTETLLFLAARREHVDRVIAPALKAGKWVVCDRFADSTMAYQGYGSKLGRSAVAALNELIFGDIRPDLTLVFDMPVAAAHRRLRSRGAPIDRFERRSKAFHERIRAGFLDIARREPDRCQVIDAARPEDEVARAAIDAVCKQLKIARGKGHP